MNPYNNFQIKKAGHTNIICLYIQRSDKSKSIIQRSQIHLEVLKQSKLATQTLSVCVDACIPGGVHESVFVCRLYGNPCLVFTIKIN